MRLCTLHLPGCCPGLLLFMSSPSQKHDALLKGSLCSAGGEGQGELQLSDLIKGLGESRKKLGAARKTLERLERRGSAVAAPLPGNVQARQERKAAYEVTAQDVAKWQPMVKVRSACQDWKSGSTEVLPPALYVAGMCS